MTKVVLLSESDIQSAVSYCEYRILSASNPRGYDLAQGFFNALDSLDVLSDSQSDQLKFLLDDADQRIFKDLPFKDV